MFLFNSLGPAAAAARLVVGLLLAVWGVVRWTSGESTGATVLIVAAGVALAVVGTYQIATRGRAAR